MTLADFLLARIAKDEKRASELMTRAQRHRVTVREPRLLGREIPGWHDWPDVEALTVRVLAECEAKRRIVEWATSDSPFAYPPILRLLALPYADHPDYREEWRP